MTGTPSPRDTPRAGGSLRLTTAWGAQAGGAAAAPIVASLGLLWGMGDHKVLLGLRGSICSSWRGEELLRSCTCLHPPSLSPVNRDVGRTNPDQSDASTVPRWNQLWARNLVGAVAPHMGSGSAAGCRIWIQWTVTWRCKRDSVAGGVSYRVGVGDGANGQGVTERPRRAAQEKPSLVINNVRRYKPTYLASMVILQTQIHAHAQSPPSCCFQIEIKYRGSQSFCFLCTPRTSPPSPWLLSTTKFRVSFL